MLEKYEEDFSQLSNGINKNLDKTQRIQEIKRLEDASTKEALLRIAEDNTSSSKKFIEAIQLSDSGSKKKITNLYIYYSIISKKNPYTDRPYNTKGMSEDNVGDFIFDKHPDKFKRIYSSGNEIIIWKIL